MDAQLGTLKETPTGGAVTKGYTDCAKVWILECRYKNQIVQEANRENRFHQQQHQAWLRPPREREPPRQTPPVRGATRM
jgi:hypothetical protein